MDRRDMFQESPSGIRTAIEGIIFLHFAPPAGAQNRLVGRGGDSHSANILDQHCPKCPLELDLNQERYLVPWNLQRHAQG